MPRSLKRTEPRKDYSRDQKIELVQDVKSFAKHEIGLQFDGLFDDVAEDGTELYWVFASSADEFRSPLSRGYQSFMEDGKSARGFAEALRLEGFDVEVRTAPAYGSDNCPITPEMLERSPEWICRAVLHEATHVHNRNAWAFFDHELEECVCDYIAFEGAKEYVKNRRKELVPGVEGLVEKKREFNELINRYYKRLDNLYKNGEAELRDGVFDEFRREINPFSDEGKTFSESKNGPINNAYFLLQANYTLNMSPVQKFMEDKTIREYCEDTEAMSARLKERDDLYVIPQ